MMISVWADNPNKIIGNMSERSFKQEYECSFIPEELNSTKEKMMHAKIDKYARLREKFKEGDWVFGLGEHKGCSPVFNHDKPNIQPFSYLDATNPNDFRFATNKEINKSKELGWRFH